MENQRELTPEQVERLKKTMQVPIVEKLQWIEKMLELNAISPVNEEKEVDKFLKEWEKRN